MLVPLEAPSLGMNPALHIKIHQNTTKACCAIIRDRTRTRGIFLKSFRLIGTVTSVRHRCPGSVAGHCQRRSRKGYIHKVSSSTLIRPSRYSLMIPHLHLKNNIDAFYCQNCGCRRCATENNRIVRVARVSGK